LILAVKEKTVKANERLITEGDDGDCMFIIESGSADCLKKIDGAEKVVKTCSAGEVFGELALLYNCPRAASVEAKEDTSLWELDRETFNNIVKESAAKKRNTYTDFLKTVPLFSNIDSYEMMTIADALKMETYPEKDTLIIKQGDVGDRFFMTLEGECVAKQLISGFEQPVMVHKKGDYFGELALIKKGVRVASVYTNAADTKVLYMERDTFKRLMGPIEDILRREAKRYD
jgi:cAMP-dependent protein kinase regulator